MMNKDKPAIPSGIAQTPHIRGEDPLYTGLTKREHFAALILASIAGSVNYVDCGWSDCASEAVAGADELLKELDK